MSQSAVLSIQHKILNRKWVQPGTHGVTPACRSWSAEATCSELLLLCSMPSRGKVVVVGGGPAGVLAAIYLAQQQYNVEVWPMYSAS